MLKKEPVKKRGIKISILLAVTAVLIAAVFSINVSSFPGKFCTGSPCACGSNCSGGNELFGQSQSYCDSNPIECFNTIDDCRDGTIVSLNYVKDINVSSLNDSVFKAGDTISIDATLFSSSANSEGVFFVYSNSSVNSSVNWSVIYNTAFGIADSNYHIKFNFTIPNRPGQHTVRVIDEFSQTRNITCGRDSDAEFPAYSDTDDVVFTVNPEPAPSINFTGPTPSNQSTVDSLTITVNVTHSEAHPDTLILYWNGTNETYSYSGSSTSIQKPNLAPGNYTFYVWVNDTFGNVNQTETRIAAVSSLVDITVKSPQNGQQLAQNSIFFNFTAKPNQANRTITSAWYVLDSDPQVPVLNRINLSADSSDQNGVINESLAGRFNLSQSFTPLLAMEAINISLRLAKTGNPNVTMQIRTDSSNSPSSTIIAEASIPNNSVSSSGFGWVNLTLNQTAVLQNGTRYWIYMPNGTSNEFYSWEANDDGISGGQLYQNTSRDLLFQLFDLYTYYIQVSSLDDDSHSIRAYVNNSDNLTFSSSLISFLTDTETPAYSSITESSDPIEVGNNMTITVDISESVTSLSSVLLSFNSTNRTMSLESGETYTVTFNAGIFGSNTYYIFANDSVGNYFNTSILSFQATDSRAPDFSALSNNPSTEDSLDPGSLINVSATITDIGYVSSAVLLYKLSNSSSWSNTSMSNSSGLYYGNFTPGQSGNWTFRIWANDSSNNANYSQNSTVEVSYDYTWTRTPSSFAAVSGIKGLNATIGNLTINNTGDFL
ncbi:MAG TPA: choice-of-anchor R domain-containing protein, partial [Candidatus Nanoarchaeia archaeon]|nr:choice-of-anchor R domain-containing protein [Candidatus Nanoarchaeia archaeon]